MNQQAPPPVQVAASRNTRYVPFSKFYSWTMMEMMTEPKLAVAPPGTVHEYYPVVSQIVVLSAFVTEATINEIAYWLDTHPTFRKPMPNDLFKRNARIREKWQAVPKASGAPAFDETTPPWTDFNALINLRNVFAHSPAYPPPPEDVLKMMERQGLVGRANDWFESLMTLRTAKWAMKTALDMPEALRSMLLKAGVPVDDPPHGWVWGPEWHPEGHG
jgi:hypothetical protein